MWQIGLKAIWYQMLILSKKLTPHCSERKESQMKPNRSSFSKFQTIPTLPIAKQGNNHEVSNPTGQKGLEDDLYDIPFPFESVHAGQQKFQFEYITTVRMEESKKRAARLNTSNPKKVVSDWFQLSGHSLLLESNQTPHASRRYRSLSCHVAVSYYRRQNVLGDEGASVESFNSKSYWFV